MNRFVIYALAVGILVGFFIGKFIGFGKKSPMEKDSILTESSTMESDTEKTPASLERGQDKLTKTPTLSNQESVDNLASLPQDWSSTLLILEDAHKKQDWKSFLQTLEMLQADKAYPLPGLTSLLKDGFAQSAINSIQNMDAGNALFVAENILKGNSSKRQKLEILKTIGKTGENAAPLLIWVAENEKDIHLSSLAINAMGETRDPAVIPFLSDFVKNHQELPLRLAAIEAFENFDSKAIPALEALLNAQTLGKGNEQLALKGTIIEALGNIGGTEAVSLLSNLSRTQEELENYDGYIIQQDAIAALGDIGSIEALSTIGEIIADEGMDAELRGFALETLVQVEKYDSIPILEDIINDSAIQDLEIKEVAIVALGELKGPEAVPLLTELITRPNAEIPTPLQSKALNVLGRIGGNETVPVLETIINNEYIETDIRTEAIFTLGKVGTDTAVLVLESVVNDTSNPAFCRAALRGLQKIGSSYSISIIETIAREHPSEDTRLIASKLLELSNNSR